MPSLKISCIFKKFIIIIRNTNIKQTNLKDMPQFSIGIKPHHRQKAWEKQAAYFCLNAVKMPRSGSVVN